MKPMMKKLSTFFAAALIIAGCSSGEVKQQYVLESNVHPSVAVGAQLPAISISLVQSVDYGSTLMEYTRAENEVEYFTKSEWAVPPSKMIQNQVTRLLNNSGLFKDVVTHPSDLKTPLRLDLHLLEMRHYFTSQKESHVQLEIQARLINGETGKILSSHTYREQEPSLEYNAAGGVKAYNIALDRILQQLVRDLSRGRY